MGRHEETRRKIKRQGARGERPGAMGKRGRTYAFLVIAWMMKKAEAIVLLILKIAALRSFILSPVEGFLAMAKR